jgi:hypothetical protein
MRKVLEPRNHNLWPFSACREGLKTLLIEMRSNMGASDSWTLRTDIQLELGMLPVIARESAAFFRPGSFQASL